MFIEAEILRRWLEEGRELTILDVRPKEQRAEWAIPGSRHADVYEALKSQGSAALDSVSLPPGIPVVTVCAMGKASLKAAQILREKGIEAYSLQGGMKAWSLAWNTAEIDLTGPGLTIIQVRRAGTGCLSYLIGSEGEAAIIDASVDPDVYLALAEKKSWKIVAALDTHIHADHVSRTPALATRAGAPYYLPSGAAASVPARFLGDGDSLSIGSRRLQALHTPGHTPESTCYLIEDLALFTGDTLFLNAVGRPDLARNLDRAKQALELHASLLRLSGLSESLYVLPAHHSSPPGFDGKPIAEALGRVKAGNPFLQKTEVEFVRAMLAFDQPPPSNHARIIEVNQVGGQDGGDWSSLEVGPNRCAVA